MSGGQVAYEACPDEPHKRVSWEQLTPYWREYWQTIANAVLANGQLSQGDRK